MKVDVDIMFIFKILEYLWRKIHYKNVQNKVQ